MQTEKSITKIEDLIGKNIQVIAFGASYVGVLKKVDYDKGYIIIKDNKDSVTLDLEHVESYSSMEDTQ